MEPGDPQKTSSPSDNRNRLRLLTHFTTSNLIPGPDTNFTHTHPPTETRCPKLFRGRELHRPVWLVQIRRSEDERTVTGFCQSGVVDSENESSFSPGNGETSCRTPLSMCVGPTYRPVTEETGLGGGTGRQHLETISLY